MIRAYNRKQILTALLCIAGGGICYFLTYLFFRHGPAWAASMFGIKMSENVVLATTVAGLAATTWSGYRTWQAGGGLRGYHESAFYHDLGEETAGAFVVDFYMHRITGPAHVLSQLFLGGPLLLFRARTLFASLLPVDQALDNRMAESLGILKAANKWQSINEYPEMETEILYLAQIGRIDFSAVKGAPRIKAHLEN